nr:hypothetical protein [Mucilaginibacter sp. X4EP1]
MASYLAMTLGDFVRPFASAGTSKRTEKTNQ